MHYPRVLLSLSLVVIGSIGVLGACSGDDRPATIDPSTGGDSGMDLDSGIVQRGPCDPPQEGCPCIEAGVGAQSYCGIIYRTSGTHIDCAKGYRTCQEDGGWGTCEGPRVYGAE